MAGLAVPVLSEHQSASMAERQASEMTAEVCLKLHTSRFELQAPDFPTH